MEDTTVLVLERPSRRRWDVLTALSMWTPRHVLIALAAAVAIALLIGLPSVLIPNPVFGREIPTAWWNYPVWLLTSGFSGMLIATYVTPDRPGADKGSDENRDEARSEQRSSRLGLAGGALAWFAVGCPVCNKIVLLVLGYSGALTWFAPAQPYLAVIGLLLTGIALFLRLRGQVSCPVPTPQKETDR